MGTRTSTLRTSCPTHYRGLRQVLCWTLLCTLALFSGCTGSHSAQGVKYSGKNTKKYTPLPISVHEDKLIELLENISSLLGIEYHYGGQSVTGFDCSGFVNYIYKDTFKAYLPRTSQELARRGKKISLQNLKRGDLVFFRLNSSRINHVGIYLENNLFAHASSSRGVTMTSLNNGYYKKHFVKALRLLEIMDTGTADGEPRHARTDISD
ncbi:MAG: C40 family peptidase [Chlorobium phaeobacteroides]|uniref:NLP/P60 protein n=1 Tax=Chlorobium phaeobacteroides (strain BS1) TaxID=331678 RepID=B3EPV1_CHLPB|nr:C40 family peptidase [Chlorobium phaeobacteroides]